MKIEEILLSLPDEIYSIQLELLDSLEKEMDLEEQLKEIEINLADEVYNAVDENNKPLCSNDAKRKVAIEQSKKNNKEYNKILENYKFISKENKILKLKLEKLLNLQSNYRAIARMYCSD